ncbi:ribonucleoside triphosphate reductase [Candidatus Margulisiibacteriota bacterium]
MAIIEVRKRNGQIVKFEPEKITEAIYRAAKAVGGYDKSISIELSAKVIEEVEKRYHAKTIPAIEAIQDIIEKILIENGHAQTAKAYILYREQHKRLRETKALLIDIEKTMDGYLKQSDWRVNENSNVNYSLGGLILHNSGAITANYWLNNIYTSDIADAHRHGDMHIHDLSMFSGYCAGWSLRQLIQEGLGGVKNKINSKPANHLSTLISQMINFLGTMQNEWAGAQAFSSFDSFLAPFVRADNLTYKEVKQQVQSFVFSVNTPSRWGSQSPFTNITLDWVIPEDLKNRPVIVGGKELDSTYGDYQKEMDMINKAFLEVMMEGDADGRGFPYPIPTYNITRDFVWDSENANLLFEMTAKYGTPYFQNFVNSDLDPQDVRSMCCRLQLDKRELKKRGGGLFGADEFTGSIGVVTINMSRIGYLAKTREEYFTRLERLMNIAKNSLITKRKIITKLIDEGLFPYTKRYLQHLNNHFSTIGIIGMNESCLNFMDKDIAEPESLEFTKEVLDYMRQKLSDFQEETGSLFNLEATPGEGTSYRLAKIDKEMFGNSITTSGEKDPFYTNSTQLPVGYTTDIFTALDIQDSIQTKYTGGTVFHGFLGEMIDDPEACKSLVKKIAYNYHMPYFTISPTFSICPEHGYQKGEHFYCPHCGTESEVYTRIVGYYRSVQNWNLGKKSEYKQRKAYDMDIEATPETVQVQPTTTATDDSATTAQPVTSGEKPVISAYKLFYSDTCPNCPAVKEYVANLDLQGEVFNASTDEGLDEARKYGIYSTPTVILFDEQENILSQAHTASELNECLVS